MLLFKNIMIYFLERNLIKILIEIKTNLYQQIIKVKPVIWIFNKPNQIGMN